MTMIAYSRWWSMRKATRRMNRWGRGTILKGCIHHRTRHHSWRRRRWWNSSTHRWHHPRYTTAKIPRRPTHSPSGRWASSMRRRHIDVPSSISWASNHIWRRRGGSASSPVKIYRWPARMPPTSWKSSGCSSSSHHGGRATRRGSSTRPKRRSAPIKVTTTRWRATVIARKSTFHG